MSQLTPASAIDELEALPDKDCVAALAGAQIEELERDELIRAIKAARVPFIRPSDEKRLEMYDNDTLRRLVYLSRRMCRNQGY
jgi:hypothetical protein